MSTDNLNDIATQTYIRLYNTACRMMEEQHPFTDPAFDLVVLARLVGTNRTQLSTAINQHAHVSFSNWLAQYRIHYLLQLIERRPGIPIDELYPAAGFSQRSTFYRQFRQITGLSPGQYLRLKADPPES